MGYNFRMTLAQTTAPMGVLPGEFNFSTPAYDHPMPLSVDGYALYSLKTGGSVRPKFCVPGAAHFSEYDIEGLGLAIYRSDECSTGIVVVKRLAPAIISAATLSGFFGSKVMTPAQSLFEEWYNPGGRRTPMKLAYGIATSQLVPDNGAAPEPRFPAAMVVFGQISYR